ncbi:hypothetical protein ATK36_2213 [Amycolatopsis sulphurea]|uniref:Enoyl reductase (ER) domain-containing protein n=1 Tax=Amycolatopsis sulphurea TaxID=76022 RepID=A0A2A9F763_9PSEU|nr:NADP-dependent oxidoreductase [Amycolatopsis sulphurea]PFG47184.1 hypothetical protein ATK36_2213 [Amycolatopsis sulphurea]
MTTSRQFVLARRPQGRVREDDFSLVQTEIGPVPNGGIRLETLVVSLDPAIRGWLDDRPSYLPPVAIGAPVRSFGLARVTESRNPGYRPGDVVRGFVGWQERQVVPEPDPTWERITPEPGIPLETALGVLGMPGLTAWVGVHDILRPEPGQTMLISGASGAVGTLAVQLAKRAGARVLGIAGGTMKCALLTEQLGLDAAIDRHDPDWCDHLTAATPEGIDLVFENSGGPMFDATIARLENHARIALCGLIDGYNQATRPAGPANFGLLLTKRVLTQGFIVLDHLHRAPEIGKQLAGLIRDQEIQAIQTVEHGFDRLPVAFVGSFTGGHLGKLLVDLT